MFKNIYLQLVMTIFSVCLKYDFNCYLTIKIFVLYCNWFSKNNWAAVSVLNLPSLLSLLQLYNFLRFCEMLLKASCKVQSIHLLTSQDEVGFFNQHISLCSRTTAVSLHPVLQADSSQQSSALAELKGSLSAHGITLDLQFSSTIHDREIRYNWNVSLFTLL